MAYEIRLRLSADVSWSEAVRLAQQIEDQHSAVTDEWGVYDAPTGDDDDRPSNLLGAGYGDSPVGE